MEPNPKIYYHLIDPLLKGVREKIYKNIPSESNVIDIACGTGSLVRILAGKCKHVTGIDLDESMISFAEKIKAENTRFLVADARDLSRFENNQFDVVTMSLAYHQFRSEDRLLILNEAMRIGKKIIISDYSFPAPSGIKKFAVYTVERIAGKEHFYNFKSYMNEEGLANVSEISQLQLLHTEKSGSGVFMLGVFDSPIN